MYTCTLNREPTPTPREKKGTRVGTHVHSTMYEVLCTMYMCTMYMYIQMNYSVRVRGTERGTSTYVHSTRGTYLVQVI